MSETTHPEEVLREALNAAAEFRVVEHEGALYVMPDREGFRHIAMDLADWRESMDEALAALDQLLQERDELARKVETESLRRTE